MINPEIHTFLDRWDNEWSSLPDGATPADRRVHFEQVARNMRLPTPDGVSTDEQHTLPSPAGDVRVRLFRPNGTAPLPCLIYMHGGAWMQGSPETHWDITARLADWAQVCVISVDYAKAPERPFPAALDQVEAVARWAFANAETLGILPSKIAIGGDSAGGNLAAAATLDLRGECTFCAQLLIYPACDEDRTRPSYLENPDGPLIKPDGKVEAMYCPDRSAALTHRVWPLLADSHANLPPAFIAVAEHDPLRDSGVAYADALQQAGVNVTLDRGEGLIHGYLRAMEYCQDSMTKLQKMATWLAGQNAA
jgi:acetyl esterase